MLSPTKADDLREQFHDRHPVERFEHLSDDSQWKLELEFTNQFIEDRDDARALLFDWSAGGVQRKVETRWHEFLSDAMNREPVRIEAETRYLAEQDNVDDEDR
jgi:hypothetical protein